MLPTLLFPKFQMDRNTWVPILNIYPALGIFSWVLPLYIHARLPETLEEFFLSPHNSFAYLRQPSDFVVFVSVGLSHNTEREVNQYCLFLLK